MDRLPGELKKIKPINYKCDYSEIKFKSSNNKYVEIGGHLGITQSMSDLSKKVNLHT